MGRKKQAAGTQRTVRFNVRVKPDFGSAVAAKLEWLRKQPGCEKAGVAMLARIAIFEYCRLPNDPRVP